MKSAPSYLKISLVTFATNSRDARELRSAQASGWQNIQVIAPAGQAASYQDSSWSVKEINLRPYGDGGLKKLLGKMAAFWHFIKSARQVKADVISGHDLLGLLIAFLASIGRKNKPFLLYDAHEYENGRFTNKKRSWFKRKFIAGLEKKLIRKSKLSILVNQSIYEQMQKDYGLNFPAVVARNIPDSSEVNLGKSAAIRKQWREELALTEGEPVFIYHGLVGPGRGIEEAIVTVSDLAYGGLVILGYGADSYKEKLKDLSQASPTSKRIMLHEAVPGSALMDHLAAADVGLVLIRPVSQSYYFALPNKLFESIQAGNPVLASDLPEIARVVKDYEVGLLCNMDDPADIRSKWEQLAQGNREKTYRANLQRAKADLNWQKEGHDLEKALGDLLVEVKLKENK